MYRNEVFQQRFIENKILIVIRVDSVEDALEVAKAVVSAGVRQIEFTSTIPSFEKAIEKAKELFGGEVMIGGGTILDKELAEKAIKAGVDFVVNPIQNFEVIEVARKYDKGVLIGGFTPTEIYNSWKAGADLVKVFPASILGTSFIKAIKAPMPFLKIMTSGGMTLQKAKEFIEAGANAFAVGTEIVQPKLVAQKKFEEIKNLTKAYVKQFKKDTNFYFLDMDV